MARCVRINRVGTQQVCRRGTGWPHETMDSGHHEKTNTKLTTCWPKFLLKCNGQFLVEAQTAPGRAHRLKTRCRCRGALVCAHAAHRRFTRLRQLPESQIQQPLRGSMAASPSTCMTSSTLRPARPRMPKAPLYRSSTGRRRHSDYRRRGRCGGRRRGECQPVGGRHVGVCGSSTAAA